MKDFEVIQLSINEASIQGLDNRLRNQLMGCMHAHNELTVLNRVFMFGRIIAGDGELADAGSGHESELYAPFVRTNGQRLLFRAIFGDFVLARAS